jgi:hypothetical protein
MSCSCEQPEALIQYLPQQLMGAGNEGLTLFIRGVQVGMGIRAAETQKWTRIGVLLALTIGSITLLKHLDQ